MKKTILLLSILISTMSCITDRQILRNRDHILSVLEVKSDVQYRDTVIYKDRIIDVPLPKDTAKIDVKLGIEKSTGQMESLPKISVKNGLAGATAWIDRDGLHVRAYLTAEIAPVMVHDTIEIKGSIRETITTYPVRVDIPHGWYTKLALWVFSIQLVLLLGYIAWKVVPKFFPQLKLFKFLK